MTRILLLLLLCMTAPAQSAVALDRTRIIFPASEKSVQININNTSDKLPYLAQAWVEGPDRKKIHTHFMARPPLQRLEPDSKSTIQIYGMPELASLPQDRESFFWFNLKEIPSRSDKPNTLQIALHSRIKIFYRPQSIIPEKFETWDHKLVLHESAGGYRIENPTPYYMTVISITGAEKEVVDKNFEAAVIEPKSSAMVKSKIFRTPWITTINDFGGRPIIPFTCKGSVCRSTPPAQTQE